MNVGKTQKSYFRIKTGTRKGLVGGRCVTKQKEDEGELYKCSGRTTQEGLGATQRDGATMAAAICKHHRGQH